MTAEELRDLVKPDEYSEFETGGSATVCPLVADTGNRKLLRNWIEDHAKYELAIGDSGPPEEDFDLCITDAEAFRSNQTELEALKTEADPVLLPVLLLLPDTRDDVIHLDQGDIVDNVLTTDIDEIVTLPIKQAELEWRIQSLLRLRDQTITSYRHNTELSLFKQAIESSGHAVYVMDTDGTIRYVNPAFEEITGFTRDEVIGESPRILTSEEMPDSYLDELWNTIRSGDTWQGEVVNGCKNRGLYIATQTVAPVSNGNDVSAYVAVQTDITERKQREDKLQRRTRAIDEAPVGISISDPSQEDNPLIYVNDAFVEMTGYPRQEAVGTNCRFLQGERTDPASVARLREAIDAQRQLSVTLRNYRKDGTEFWNRLEIAPVKDDTGEVVNWIGFQQDVTGRKQRQEQLGVIDRVLRHNLRNMVNVSRLEAERIQSDASGSVAASAGKILEVTDQLIGLAEKERQITELLREEPTNVEITLYDRLQHVVSKVSSEYPDATVTIDCPDHVTVHATTQFEKALEELLTNAITHDDSSSPAVTVSVAQTEASIRIEVADTGPRIPEMERDILLDDEEQTPLYHGGGLGLWYVKLVTARSGGTITVEDNSPVGNIVGIELPR